MNIGYQDQQNTSEILKAKQYAAATFLHIVILIALTIISHIWGTITFGSEMDAVPLGFIVYCVRNIVLILGLIDLISAIYHFILWDRNGRPCQKDDNSSIFSDWKGGERSPVKVSLVILTGIMILAFLIVIQG